MNRRLVWLALLVLGQASCVDTAVSLVVEVEDASVAVRGETDGDVVAVDLQIHVRVGTYALAGDDFILPRASLYVDSAIITDINLMEPEGFSGSLEPGESVDVSIRGETSPGAAPSAREALCNADSIEVVVDWQAEEQPDDPLDPPLMKNGTATLMTSSISCT